MFGIKKKVKTKTKNAFKEASPEDILETIFYSELQKELKTFNKTKCSDSFIKGVENGIKAVAAMVKSEQKQINK